MNSIAVDPRFSRPRIDSITRARTSRAGSRSKARLLPVVLGLLRRLGLAPQGLGRGETLVEYSPLSIGQMAVSLDLFGKVGGTQTCVFASSIDQFEPRGQTNRTAPPRRGSAAPASSPLPLR